MCVLVALGSLVAACGGSDSDVADPGAGGRGSGEAAITMVVADAVHAMDGGLAVFDAFAFDETGEILSVGTVAEVEAAVGADVERVEVGGTVVPGFQDIHVHVPEAGINESLCLWPAGESLDEYGRLAASCARDQTGEEWVRAAGASLFDLRESDTPPIEVLDDAVPDRPVLVLDDLGHAVWTNTLGLAAAGIDEDAADPPGGVFDRDPVTGALNGLLLENAQHRIRDVAASDPEAVEAGLALALDRLAAQGVTTVSDSGGYWTRGHVDAWRAFADSGRLTVRAHNGLYLFPDKDVDSQIDELTSRFRVDADDMLSIDTVKIYVDGILDLGTASMLDPYEDPIDADRPHGFEYFDEGSLQEYVPALHEAGFRFEFHVIGDAAVRTVLDLVESLGPGAADRRHRTTHTYLVAESDLGRYAELGVVADFQAGPDSIDVDYHESLRPLIGDRADRLLPTADLLAAGATVTLSSDWDADPLSPLGTVARALTRQTQAVPDLDTALAMVTIDAAFALGHDDVTGSIEVGKQADFVVLGSDPYEVEAGDIADIEVLETVVGGRWVFVG